MRPDGLGRAEDAPLQLGRLARWCAVRDCGVTGAFHGGGLDSILRQRSACPQGEFDAG
jgi:hypothetical protein